MKEKYNLALMLREIAEDEQLAKEDTKKAMLTQQDIAVMVKSRRGCRKEKPGAKS